MWPDSKRPVVCCIHPQNCWGRVVKEIKSGFLSQPYHLTWHLNDLFIHSGQTESFAGSSTPNSKDLNVLPSWEGLHLKSGSEWCLIQSNGSLLENCWLQWECYNWHSLGLPGVLEFTPGARRPLETMLEAWWGERGIWRRRFSLSLFSAPSLVEGESACRL